LALDVNQIDAAIAIVNRSTPDTTAVSPQLDAAVLEACLAAWQQATKAGQTSTAEQWRQRAVTTVQRIEQTHSPYWAYQAEALLASRIVASPTTSDTAELVRAAESFYRVGKFDEALATYDKAIERARANGRLDEAFAPTMAAAAIEQQQKRYAEAARRLRAIALEQPRHEKAAAAHLSAIYNTAQRLSNAEPSELGEYVAMLDEHLRLWPGGPTADRARLWLGRIRERQRAWPEAVAAYGGIASDGDHTAEAIEGVSRCYKAWLESLKARNEPTTQLATDAATFFENVITGGAGLPTQWTSVQREAALDAARMWLEFTNAGAPRAQRILESALAASGETSSEWREAARCWLALSLVAQGKHTEAAAMLEQFGGDAASALSLLSGLGRAAKDATPETRRQLAELSLRVADRLQSQVATLSPTQRRDVTLSIAHALADLGRTSEATAKLAALAAESPKDADLQEAYADALVETRETASEKLALERYRSIEQNSRPGSERWFRAKYGIVLAHERLGQHDRAVQIIRVTRLLHPDMGSGELRAKFDAISAE
jgi:tetratricopeptide (TPR) repeat protein